MLENVTRRRVESSTPGLELALLDWGGSGPLALLHHANGFCAATWGLVAEQLRERFRVVAVDARGHGASDPPGDLTDLHWGVFRDDLLAVADALLAETGETRIALGLGHSFGGAATVLAAGQRPDLFERLLLLDPIIQSRDLYTPDRGELMRGNPMAEGARRRRHTWPDRDDVRTRWGRAPLFEHWDPRALELYVEHGTRETSDGQRELCCQGETEARIFETAWRADPWAIAAKIPIPVQIVWASRDSFPREAYDEFAAVLPNGRVDALACGHLIPMEEPARVAEFATALCGD